MSSYKKARTETGKKGLFPFIFLMLTVIFGQPVAAQSGGTATMASVNGGTFLMGSPASDNDRANNEMPQHKVAVNSFLMAKHPVTQAEYQEVTGKSPSYHKGANLPVEQVSWFDAVEYCNQLSVKEGLKPAYTINGTNVSWDRAANGYRLPTEAEWEYACRAGTQTPFYSGTAIGDAGWHAGNSKSQTQPVGQKQPNDFGIYDMHGNVLEWCWDWFGDYSSSDQTNPDGPALGSQRVYRGGCWRFDAHQNRSAFRFGNKPDIRIFILGFRVARSM